MNLLMDTHILLWWLADDPKLTESERSAIADVGNLVVVSAVVIWEIRIKQALGKLKIASNFYRVVHQQGFELLSVSPDHAYAVGDLPLHHRDPFDRMLVAQAATEGLTLITHDDIFRKYDIPVLSV
ncbi:MAG: type II toxin-antitoxin system VapC family toxin [Desulfobacterales bacterium]|nr:type II toxin-antitoxin system VapC family toxin [Desulfobacterales bacterium]